MYNRAPQSKYPTRKSVDVAFALLTFTAVTFRSEVALLLAAIAIQTLLLQHTSFLRLVRVGVLSGLSSIGACCPLPFCTEWVCNCSATSFNRCCRFIPMEPMADMARTIWRIFQCLPGQEFGVGCKLPFSSSSRLSPVV